MNEDYKEFKKQATSKQSLMKKRNLPTARRQKFKKTKLVTFIAKKQKKNINKAEISIKQ